MAFRNNLYCNDIQEVKECIEKCSNMICHVMKADNNKWDSKYIVVAHIVCEYCSMCESQGDMRGVELTDIPEYSKVEWEG